MHAIPYLFFNGQAHEALATYSRIFKTEPMKIIRMSDAPPQVEISEAQANWILHCELPIGSTSIYLSDDFAANAPQMEGCSVMVSCATEPAAKAVFDGLAEWGTVRKPWKPTFWAAGYGSLTDRFGIRWMITCDEPPPVA